MLNMTNIIVLGYASDVSLSKQIKNKVMTTKKVLSHTRRQLLLRFVSLVKGEVFISIEQMEEDVPATFEAAESLDDRYLNQLIEQLEERLGD